MMGTWLEERGEYERDKREEKKKRENAPCRHFISPAVSSRYNKTCYKQGLRIQLSPDSSAAQNYNRRSSGDKNIRGCCYP